MTVDSIEEARQELARLEADRDRERKVSNDPVHRKNLEALFNSLKREDTDSEEKLP